ncbi:MAG: ABC transporter substrate-binding protein, partial [Candidatus Thorarchaeota archaeon]|nr:ABC transporter substrate-binding protein [Candidatus Thorarchaeota archaeon]
WDSGSAEPTVPLLAESLELSADGRNYTFTLRQGITFHDGTPFNASCVKYNIERVLGVFDGWGPAWMIAEPILGGQTIEDAVYMYGEGSSEHIAAYNVWKDASDMGTGALIVLDDYVIRIRLAYAYTPFLAALTYTVGSMMSPTYVENHGGVVVGEHNTWMDEHACGTGPYELVQWIPDEQIQLTRNDDYWRKNAAQALNPNAGSISGISISTNDEVNSRILNIKAGESDGVYWPVSMADDVYNGVTGDSGDGTLKTDDPNLKLWCDEPTFNVIFLGFF